MKLSDLTPDNRNANKGTAKGQKAIVNSIQRSGAGRSIVVDKHGQIIGGNKTAEAIAEVFGAETEVQVIETDGKRLLVHKRTDLDLSDPSPNNPARQLAYADNLTSWASFELDPAQVMADIEAGFDFEAVDISLPDLGELLGKAANELLAGDNAGEDTEPQIDKAEELRQKWGVEPGQMWQLGSHRLICGDCTDPAVVTRVMGGEKAEICFTSPPYSDIRTYNGSDLSIDKIVKFIPESYVHCNYFVVNLGIKRKESEMVLYWDDYIKSAQSTGLKLISWNVWDKGRATSIGSQSAMFAIEHEFIFIFGAREKDLNRTVEKSQESDKRLKYAKKDKSGRLIRSKREADGSFSSSTIGNNFENKNLPTIVQCFPQMARDITTAHPAPFPVDLPEIYISAMTNKGETVYEPFSGSGTTIIACENLARRCRAIEISPAYVGVALQRFLDHTGIQPVLLSE